MAIKKRGLGRGLDALLGNVGAGPSAHEPGEDLVDLDVSLLEPGAHQPRRNFDAAQLDSLADSIRSQGVVQPIVVRPIGGGRYEIVAGERRWRAVQKIGQKTIPGVVRAMDDRAAMAVALIENMQRTDLNPLEEATGIKKLIDEVGLTHEQCSEALGFSRVQVTNLLRLFELNEDVQALLRTEKLSLGHAKVLLGVGGPRQSSLASLIIARGYSVRQTEELVRQALAGRGGANKGRKPSRSPIETDLSQRIGLPVRVQQGGDGSGRVTIRFKQKSELDKLVKLLR
ncbi:MAG TPA: ParB/RepB/Spo0J family partition protein [Verrucomicrobiae bacterium]|nr:ParB/RepB/Spo0J family partition protein [Verrucomicrobiae bacterium]